MLKLILLNLKDLAHKNKSLFVVMIVTQIIAFVCVLFTFGLTENAINSKIEANYENTTFDVNLVCNVENDSENIDQSYTFNEVKDKLNDIIETTEGKWEDFACYGFVKSDNNYYGYYGIDHNGKYEYSLNNGLSYDDIAQGNCIVSVNDISYPCKTGDKINVGSRMFTVSDTDEYYYNSFIVPYKSLNDDFLIRRFKITLNDIPTKQLVANIGNAIVNQFGLDIDMLIPTVPDLLTEQYIRTAFLISFVAMFIIAINVCHLNKYILNRHKKKMMVYRVLGCKISELTVAYCVQMAIITLISELIGILIFSCLLNRVISDIFDFQEYFSTMVYSIMLIAYLCITTIVMLLSVISYTKHTAIEMRG